MTPYYNPEIIAKMREPNMDYLRMQNPNIQMPSKFGNQAPPQSGGNFFQNNSWATQDSSGVGAIGSAATQMLPAEQGRFDIDPNAGFKGSFGGLSSGGVIGAIAGGIGAQMGTFSKVNQNLKNLDTNVSAMSKDAYGNPIYQGGEITQAQATSKELQAGEKSINKGIDPATRVFAGLYGTKKKLRRANKNLQANIKNAQNQYNQADIQSVQKRNQMEEYYDRNNKSARMNNLYRIPTSFQQMY
jgi:hypothetical protein